MIIYSDFRQCSVSSKRSQLDWYFPSVDFVYHHHWSLDVTKSCWCHTWSTVPNPVDFHWCRRWHSRICHRNNEGIFRFINIKPLATIMLTSWAPHSLSFPSKEGAGRSTYSCPCPLIFEYSTEHHHFSLKSITSSLLRILNRKTCMKPKNDRKFYQYGFWYSRIRHRYFHIHEHWWIFVNFIEPT